MLPHQIECAMCFVSFHASAIYLNPILGGKPQCAKCRKEFAEARLEEFKSKRCHCGQPAIAATEQGMLCEEHEPEGARVARERACDAALDLVLKEHLVLL